MNKSDLPRFSNALFGTFEVYGKQVSKTLVDIWWAALANYSIDEVCTALTRHITDPDSGQFPPKPADIVRALSGSKDGKAMIAWAKFESAISRVGSYGSVCFDDKLINRCIEDLGGWQKLCGMTEDDLKFQNNHFQKLYKSYCISPPLEYPSHLIGREEQAAKSGDYEFKGPMLIGNKEQAKIVFSNGGKGNSLAIEQLSETKEGLKLISGGAA